MNPKITLQLFFFLLTINIAQADEISLERQSELKHLLLHDCGSCHGMTLKGGLGPSLIAEDLSDKSEAFLFQTINDGRPNTPMPPWGNILSKKDIAWLVSTLKQGLEQ